MKDIYQLLRDKEQQLKKVEREVEALRISVALLNEDNGEAASAGYSASKTAAAPPPPVPESTSAAMAAAKRWP